VPPYLLHAPSLISLNPPLRLPPLSPASIAPLAVTSPAPAISWLSEHLPPACKAGKTLLLDGFKLSSMAVLYLPSFGWTKVQNVRILLTGNGIMKLFFYFSQLPLAKSYSKGGKMGKR
jgi:hypothetical protein